MRSIGKGWMALGAIVMLLMAGCTKQEAKPQQALAVNTYKVVVQDATISEEYAGSILARNQVPVRSRVTGNVVEKYIHGGQYVEEGTPLYRIDSRSYDSALAAAQAGAAQASVLADNARIDLERYEVLAQNDAVAKQVLDAQRAKASQSEAAYRAAMAQVSIAKDNVNDTIIRAPFSGTLGMDDVDLGTFVAAGQVPLVTIQSTNPVLVQFSMSEEQYLQAKQESNQGDLGALQLRLSNGSMYPITGKVVEVSKALQQGSGQITLKAEFDNPQETLLPGMFATIVSHSKEVKNAILIPTKALVQILDKDFVMVVDANGKVVQRAVKRGAVQGYFTVVTGDIHDGDEVIVDGLTKVKPGMDVKATILSKQEIEKGK